MAGEKASGLEIDPSDMRDRYVNLQAAFRSRSHSSIAKASVELLIIRVEQLGKNHGWRCFGQIGFRDYNCWYCKEKNNGI